MAKALIGHLAGDPHTAARLATDNRRLRGRVAELEKLVLRLQAEHDQLEARLQRARPADAPGRGDAPRLTRHTAAPHLRATCAPGATGTTRLLRL